MNKTEWKKHYREEQMNPRKWYGHFIGFQQQNDTMSAGYTMGHVEVEGNGRAHRAGGDACDYCPYCNGSANWCPLMD